MDYDTVNIIDAEIQESDETIYETYEHSEFPDISESEIVSEELEMPNVSEVSLPKYAIAVSEEGAVLSATFSQFASGDEVFMDYLPEGDITDYDIIEGEYVLNEARRSIRISQQIPKKSALQLQLESLESSDSDMMNAILELGDVVSEQDAYNAMLENAILELAEIVGGI